MECSISSPCVSWRKPSALMANDCLEASGSRRQNDAIHRTFKHLPACRRGVIQRQEGRPVHIEGHQAAVIESWQQQVEDLRTLRDRQLQAVQSQHVQIAAIEPENVEWNLTLDGRDQDLYAAH